MALSFVHSLINGVTGSVSEISEYDARGVEHPSEEPLFPLQLHRHVNGADYLDTTLDERSGNKHKAKAWVSRAYVLWKQWTEYLIEFSLEPANQLSTDDFAGPLELQTNLALKGIVGIKAMSELAALTGNHDDYKYHKNISDTYVKKWQELGMSRDGSHAKLAYNWFGSWTTLYSLFADAILCFHTESAPQAYSLEVPLAPATGSSETFIPHAIYQNQSIYYALVMQKYGLPLDSRHLYAKSDWEFQVAATASPNLRREIISRVARWLNETETNTPFSDLYWTEGAGGYAPGTRFTARPVIGSHFSLLALDQACKGKAIVQSWDLTAEIEN